MLSSMGYIVSRFVYGKVIRNVSVSLLCCHFFSSLFQVLTDFFYLQAVNRAIRFDVKVEGIGRKIS